MQLHYATYTTPQLKILQFVPSKTASHNWTSNMLGWSNNDSRKTLVFYLSFCHLLLSQKSLKKKTIGRYCASKLALTQGILKAIQRMDVRHGKLLPIVDNWFYNTFLLKTNYCAFLVAAKHMSREKNVETQHGREPFGDKNSSVCEPAFWVILR